MKKVIFLTFVLLVLTVYSQTKTINQQLADLQIEYKLQQREIEQLKTKIEEVEKQSDKNFSTYQNTVSWGISLVGTLFAIVVAAIAYFVPFMYNRANAKEITKVENHIKKLNEELREINNAQNTFKQQLVDMEDIKKKVLELEQQAQKSAKQSEESAKQSEAIRLFTEALKEEDIDRKITLYTEAIEINPKFAEAYNNRGVAYAYKQYFDDAIKDYTNALYVNSHNNKTCDNSGVCHNRGNAYFNKQDYQNAIKDYTQSIILNPHLVKIYEDRASAYRQLAQQDSNKSVEYIKLAEADEAQAKKLKSINK